MKNKHKNKSNFFHLTSNFTCNIISQYITVYKVNYMLLLCHYFIDMLTALEQRSPFPQVGNLAAFQFRVTCVHSLTLTHIFDVRMCLGCYLGMQPDSTLVPKTTRMINDAPGLGLIYTIAAPSSHQGSTGRFMSRRSYSYGIKPCSRSLRWHREIGATPRKQRAPQPEAPYPDPQAAPGRRYRCGAEGFPVLQSSAGPGASGPP